jgi:hypothetical protein
MGAVRNEITGVSFTEKSFTNRKNFKAMQHKERVAERSGFEDPLITTRIIENFGNVFGGDEQELLPEDPFDEQEPSEKLLEVYIPENTRAMMEHFGVSFFPENAPTDLTYEGTLGITDEAEPETPFFNTEANLESLSEFLDSINASNHPHDTPFSGLQDHDLPKPKSRMVIKKTEQFAGEPIQNIKRLRVKLRGRNVTQSNPNEVLRSLILRGAVEQPTIDKHKNMISEAMINALTTYVPKPHKVTVEEYMLCVGEQMRKVSAKNDLDQSITYDPNVFEDSKKIKCFLK